MSCCAGCSMFKRRRDGGVTNHPVAPVDQNVLHPRPSSLLQEDPHLSYPSSNNSAQVRVDPGYGYPPAAAPLRPNQHSGLRTGHKETGGMVAERKPPFVRDPLTLSVDFLVRYVGMIATAQGLQHSQEDHLDLIQALDQAQMDGQFKFAENDQDFVTLNLSKYGMKIVEKLPQDRYQVPSGMRPPQVVRWRHGLVEIIRAVHYEDSLGRQLMAVKLGQEGEEVYDCLLFECTHQPQATQICKCLELLFNAVCQFTPL
ncbi:integrin beta-1-binding protein 1-like [Diadema setosum]|uniref:integrin beta-1-binding protein 1-like n=1 Tax=Diadema setosum TaxID=31175 RepID=UPI003B3AA150